MWRTLLLSAVVLISASAACNKNGEGCLLMRNVLRNPLGLSNWKQSSLNRAIHQLQAYQQLFDEMEDSLCDLKKMRAEFVRRKVLKFEFETFTKFEKHTRHLWALYQQAVVGDVNVPKLNYMEVDEGEKSWMWRWINGNEKWHAWNKCRGLSKQAASDEFVKGVVELRAQIEQLTAAWKKEISNEQ